MQGEAGYGFIISLDTQGSGAVPDSQRPALRNRIYEVAEGAFERAGLAEEVLFQEDRGDGILAVVEPRRTERVAGEWVEHLHQNLRAANAGAARPLRLRVGLAVGPVTPDGHGFSGAAVDLACRIGNCAEAKRVLAAAEGAPLLIAVTDRLYQDVIAPGGRWIEPGHYRQYTAELPEGPYRPWFMVPGRQTPPLPGEGDAPAAGEGDARRGAGERRAPTGEGPNSDGPTGDGPTGDGPTGGGDHFHFGPVTHDGSGSILQGRFGDITFDHRGGER